MAEASNTPAAQGAPGTSNAMKDLAHEGRLEAELDIDRMVNEGLGGGQVTPDNGLIDESTTDDLSRQQ